MAKILTLFNNMPKLQLSQHKTMELQRKMGLNKYAQNLGNAFWIISGGIVTFVCANWLKMDTLHASDYETVKMNVDDISEVTAKAGRRHLCHKISQLHLEKYVQLTPQERQFIRFASVEYEKQIYMTPKDFLDSLVEHEPKPRLKRHVLTKQNIERIRFNTPSMKKASTRLFRSIRDNGIISYTEYLFLLSILTEPRSAFRIAFKMFDTDCNRNIDLQEFLIIHKILGGSYKEQEVDENTRKVLLHLVSEEQAKSLKVWKPEKKAWFGEYYSSDQNQMRAKIKKKIHHKTETKEKKRCGKIKEELGETTDQETETEETGQENGHGHEHEPVENSRIVMTTLLSHLFGANGDDVMDFNGLAKFIDDIQREVVEVEFNGFSKGHNAISEVDFTRILLRYTYMEVDKYDDFLERLLSRMDDEEGIPFEDFLVFCRFLNHLDDFVVALRMYTIAMGEKGINHENFQRAVKICTGYSLSRHIVDIIFALFDVDGDGLISYAEFIAIMKDRLFRGFKSTQSYVGWDAFKSCVNNELKYA